MIRPELHAAERPNERYCFGDYVLDLEGGFLRRRGEEISLRPKSFEVLACLVQHHGRLVTKTALMETIWPDTAVTDSSLAHLFTRNSTRIGRQFAAINPDRRTPGIRIHRDGHDAGG